jgi:hypothetical protein
MQQIGDGVKRPVWLARRLRVIWVLAAALMVIAAVNLVMVFVLFSANPQSGRADTGLGNFLVPIAVAAIPFLGTAGFMATRGRRGAGSLALISGIGLPFIFLFGFWIGLFASAQELPVGSSSAAALTIYQFTWLASVLADGLTLVAALLARRTA